ncbi:hypothetical protein IMSHALPRED_005275 [Imshaugia aleurites]|uniref:Uncharacterized protein n=1 Tax=Imshaugia aleurites TaxID=172621 RepID=A0A8H3IBE6_9LECA|nr:hypothetical protein IMSHALPRED_005275 [Imshaugia aleurites]
MSAKLALLIPTIIALNIPIHLNSSLPITPFSITANNTPSHLPSSLNTNLELKPWPKIPFTVNVAFTTLDLVIVELEPFTPKETVTINLVHLCGFITGFGTSLENQHLKPDFVPRFAGDSTIDPQSCTQWQITITELMFGNRLPTPWAVAALEQITQLLRVYGVPGHISCVLQEGETYYSGVYLGLSEISAGTGNNVCVRG